MAPEYDELRDLWYGYLFDRLHRFLERRYEHRAAGLDVLDVGCGTGHQSLPFAEWGAHVTALDLAAEPIRVARDKARRVGVLLSPLQGSAADLPVASARFDLVVSFGSVISFVPDYDAALAEMRRVLRPGGELAIEFEHRGSPDLLWPIADLLLGGPFRYRQSLRTAIHTLVAPWDQPVQIDYPFTRPDGVEVNFRLWLFGRRAIDRVLARHGFERIERHSIHSLTNLLPSTVLNDPHPSETVRRLFAALARAEDRVRHLVPFDRLGNSLLVVARRR